MVLRTFIPIVIFMVLSHAADSSAQESWSPRIFKGFDGTHCETTKAELDLVAQTVGRDKTVIIIARLSAGEASRTINRRRLGGLRDYLESVRAFPPDKLITAEGERVRGLGQVELYVGGELFMVFTLNRNKDFWRGCSTA
jgi:hypothetical protein